MPAWFGAATAEAGKRSTVPCLGCRAAPCCRAISWRPRLLFNGGRGRLPVDPTLYPVEGRTGNAAVLAVTKTCPCGALFSMNFPLCAATLPPYTHPGRYPSIYPPSTGNTFTAFIFKTRTFVFAYMPRACLPHPRPRYTRAAGVALCGAAHAAAAGACCAACLS
jgi:hypothetical protein